MEGYRKGGNEERTEGRMGGKRRGCIREELKKQLENRLQDPIFTCVARVHKEREEKMEKNSPMKQHKKMFSWVRQMLVTWKSTEKGQHRGGTRSAPKHPCERKAFHG